MAQWLAALVALPEDAVQIPAPMSGSSHTIAINSSFRGSKGLFWPS